MEKVEKERKEKLSFRFVPTRRVIENYKKIVIKLKKLKKNSILASFQAKIGWKRQRNRENKNYRSVPFRSVPTQPVIENSKKVAKEYKKLKNTITV